MINLIQKAIIILLFIIIVAQHDILTTKLTTAQTLAVDFYKENQQLTKLVDACDDIALAKDLL